MRVEAIKVPEGLLIPVSEGFRDLAQDRILLEVEVIDPAKADEGYEVLDHLLGIGETGDTSASVEHDQRVYGTRTP
jgi:hypothetical protein